MHKKNTAIKTALLIGTGPTFAAVPSDEREDRWKTFGPQVLSSLDMDLFAINRACYPWTDHSFRRLNGVIIADDPHQFDRPGDLDHLRRVATDHYYVSQLHAQAWRDAGLLELAELVDRGASAPSAYAKLVSLGYKRIVMVGVDGFTVDGSDPLPYIEACSRLQEEIEQAPEVCPYVLSDRSEMHGLYEVEVISIDALRTELP